MIWRKPESLSLYCQEKLLARPYVSVPQTDSGGWVEDTKAIGETLVKELGKIDP